MGEPGWRRANARSPDASPDSTDLAAFAAGIAVCRLGPDNDLTRGRDAVIHRAFGATSDWQSRRSSNQPPLPLAVSIAVGPGRGAARRERSPFPVARTRAHTGDTSRGQGCPTPHRVSDTMGPIAGMRRARVTRRRVHTELVMEGGGPSGAGFRRISLVPAWSAIPAEGRLRRTSTSRSRSPTFPRPTGAATTGGPRTRRYDGRLLADPDALELAVRAEALVLVVERGRAGSSSRAARCGRARARAEERLEEAAARVGEVGAPGPEIGVGAGSLDRGHPSQWRPRREVEPERRSRELGGDVGRRVLPEARVSQTRSRRGRVRPGSPPRSGGRGHDPGRIRGNAVRVPGHRRREQSARLGRGSPRSSAGPCRSMACAKARRTRASSSGARLASKPRYHGRHSRERCTTFLSSATALRRARRRGRLIAASPPLGGACPRGSSSIVTSPMFPRAPASSERPRARAVARRGW